MNSKNLPAISSAAIIVPGERHTASQRFFQGIPGIEVTAKGRLWATWYAGGKGEGPDNYVVLAVSSDHGMSWKEILIAENSAVDIRTYDPALWIDPCGRLWWFWAQTYSLDTGDIYDGFAGVWTSVCENPDADNPQFGAPRRIGDGIMMNKPIAASNGEWYFPAANWTIYPRKIVKSMRDKAYSNLLVTSDQGKTFELRIGPDVKQRVFDEHNIVELKDGRLWNTVRTSYGAGESFSSDRGRTWTPGQNAGLGGPNSRFCIRRLRSGRLILINHKQHRFEKEEENTSLWRVRNNLCAWISDNEGETWKGGLLIDDRSGVSYPDLAEDSNGSIWVIYDYLRYEGGNILISHFREEDVLAGKQTAPGCFMRMLVSSYEFPKKN